MAAPSDEEKRKLRQTAVDYALRLGIQAGEGYRNSNTMLAAADQIYQYFILTSDTPLTPDSFPLSGGAIEPA